MTSFGTTKFSGIEFQLVWEKMVANHNIHLIQLKWSNFWTDRNWFQFHTSHVSLFETESGITPFFFLLEREDEASFISIRETKLVVHILHKALMGIHVKAYGVLLCKKKRERQMLATNLNTNVSRFINMIEFFFLMERHTITCM